MTAVARVSARPEMALWNLGGDLRYRRPAGQAKDDARPVGHPPVGVAEQFHQRGYEKCADHGGVEDDPGGEPDREWLNFIAWARGEHEEGEHQDQRGAGHEL